MGIGTYASGGETRRVFLPLWLLVAWGSLVSPVWLPTQARAAIPEPDAVFYGTPTVGGQLLENGKTVTARLGTELLATYTMGENPAAGDSYVLRIAVVDLSDGDARPAGATTVPATVSLLVDDLPAQDVLIEEGGEITRLDLDVTPPCVCGDGEVCEGVEDCDYNDPLDQGCCTLECTFQAAGASCDEDGDICTDDTCDAAGACLHVYDPTNHPSCVTTTTSTQPPSTTTTSTVPSSTTTTTLPTIDNYQCYRISRTSQRCEGDLGVKCKTDPDCTDAGVAGPCLGFQKVEGLELLDQFEPETVDVKKPKFLCPPVDILSDGVPIANPEVHLKAYLIKRTDGKHRKQKFLAEDQFGLHIFETKKEFALLVPTAKDLAAPVTAPSADSDDYKCYKIKEIKKRCTGDFGVKCKSDADCAVAGGLCHLGHPKGVTEVLDDQFEEKPVELKRPKLFCPPVENRAPVINPIDHLTCYLIKRSDNLKHTKAVDVHLNNVQFGAEVVSTIKEQLLCVPSLKNP